MDATTFETPVALFVFNRPTTTRRVFDAIAKVRPARLLLVADGPRIDRTGEAELCRQTREILTRVDWPCDVSANFAETNLGCQERMISGLDWVFSIVEDAIILEDDCLPDPSFFPFCRELLERYRGDDRVTYISGDNLVAGYLDINASYYFSRIGGIWGWATWRSEWKRYDRHLSDWPKLRSEGMLADIFDEPQAVAHWTRIFDSMHENSGPNTWDYQWLFTGLKNNSLTAVPKVNLVTNIGFGPAATHTTEVDSRLILQSTPIAFPLVHPSSFVPSRTLDRHRVRGIVSAPISHRVLQKIRRSARSFFRGSHAGVV
ncbi:MAG: glycosyltransferase family 2 protein [Acidobacteriota bacterium]|nr:glycosyltransferase family 2 protein [Acidobacteriota bacterium]